MQSIILLHFYIGLTLANVVLNQGRHGSVSQSANPAIVSSYGDEPVIGPPTANTPLLLRPEDAPMHDPPGWFEVVGESGVPAMHGALMPNGKVVFLDKVENYTQIKLSNGQFAYSSEYDPATRELVGLGYETNAFCCGGTFLADGRLISLGGNGPLDFLDPTVKDGFRGIRYLKRSSETAKLDGEWWEEPGNKLSTARWYATAQILADGSIFTASGSLTALDPANFSNNNPTYEILDPRGVSFGVSYPMSILERNQPYFMYPFLHLLRDGSLFVLVSKSAEVFEVLAGKPLRSLPDLPGSYRTYPNTGGSVLLPLSSESRWTPDIMICGGGSYQDITSPTDPSCGRIQPLADSPKWELDCMPEGRGMVEGTLLPDGTVIWLNGAKSGAQGFGLARNPALEVLIYDPTQKLGHRWSKGASSQIPRLYHSIALLLLDGTVLVTGSNPNEQPVLHVDPNSDKDFITDFRVETYTPPYLAGDRAKNRPYDILLSSKYLTADSSWFTIRYTSPVDPDNVKITLYHGGFSTHALHMGHRMMFLDWTIQETSKPSGGVQKRVLNVQMPPSRNIAPPGPYVIYVVVNGVPGIGQSVMVS